MAATSLFLHFHFSQASGEGSLRYGGARRMLINTEECVIVSNWGFRIELFSAQYSHHYYTYALIMLLVAVIGPAPHTGP